MLKLSGIIMLCLAVSAVGSLYCERMVRRKSSLEKLISFTVSCVQAMRCSHKSIFDIFNEYGVKELEFLKELDVGNISDTERIEEILENHNVSKRDRAVVADYLSKLGTGDLEEQKQHCEYFKLKFEQCFNEAQRDVNEKGRLFRSLSLLTGAALFIILI